MMMTMMERRGGGSKPRQAPSQLQSLNNKLTFDTSVNSNGNDKGKGNGTANELEQFGKRERHAVSYLNLEYDLLLDCDMPPAPSRLVPKDRFGQFFGGLKTQNYTDPGVRGPGSHRYSSILRPIYKLVIALKLLLTSRFSAFARSLGTPPVY